jgi:uncharacterized protein YeeX (DUF496 family)
MELRHAKAKNKLKLHKLFNEMQKIEKKVANNGKSIYNFKSYIQGKTKDMNFELIKSSCVELLE